jgi:hypothetical protein
MTDEPDMVTLYCPPGAESASVSVQGANYQAYREGGETRGGRDRRLDRPRPAAPRALFDRARRGVLAEKLTLAMTGASGVTSLAFMAVPVTFAELARARGLLGQPGRAPDPVASSLARLTSITRRLAPPLTRAAPRLKPNSRISRILPAIWASDLGYLGLGMRPFGQFRALRA